MITQDELKELLHYNPETGIFTWRISRKGAKKGINPGYVNWKGYLLICVNKKRYRSHHLAWLYMTGEWPKDQIDHINHNKIDNRFENLRCVSNRHNHKNMPLQSNNKSGLPGVHFSKRDKKWMAYITINRKRKHLGWFKDKFEAICIRKSAEKKYGFHENHGKPKDE